MRVILVPVADRPECARALKAAFDLEKRIDASLRGRHIRPHSESDTALPGDLVAPSDHRMNKANIPVQMSHT